METAIPLSSFSRIREMLQKRKGSNVVQEVRYVASSFIINDIFGSKNLELGRDGIFYITPDGHRSRGYLFLLENPRSSYPKAHICECAALRDYKGKRTGRFVWANKCSVHVKMAGHFGYNAVNRLEICSSCLYALDSYKVKGFPMDTVDFVRRLEHNSDDELFKSHEDRDIFGRTRGWYAIRQGYLEEKNYTCEECGRSFDSIDQRPFIDVITVEGSAEQRMYRNLKCLCVGCLHTLRPEHFAGPFRSSIYHMYVRRYESSEKKKAIADLLTSLNKAPNLLVTLASGTCKR